MSLLRAFIAIDLPPEIKKTISIQTASLKKDSGQAVRWVAAENIHLTIKFLGEISSANLELLTQAMRAECEQHHSFQVTVEKLGCFPNPRRPRVIWIGLVIPPEINRLQHQIEAITTRLGYATEDKPFAPHLTIGRVREQANASELQTLRTTLEHKNIGSLGTFTAGAVQLFKSELKPGGPVYTCLATAPLTN
jgi:2'-5' RNA ligase